LSIVESEFVDKKGQSQRDESLPLKNIDEDYLKDLIEGQVREFHNSHSNFFDQREDWLLALRDLRYQYKEGYFEHASDLHVPYTLIMTKALHARIFQTFSQKNFFAAEARNSAFEEKEQSIKFFMDWVLSKWMNRGEGKQDVLDSWIQDIIDEGSGILKLGWEKWQHKFLDLEIDVETEEVPQIFPGTEELEIEKTDEVKAKIRNKKKTKNFSAPRAWVVPMDDFMMPTGRFTVQNAPWLVHKFSLRDHELKLRVKQGKFDKKVVEEALEKRKSGNETASGGTTRGEHKDTRQRMRELEGGDSYVDFHQSI